MKESKRTLTLSNTEMSKMRESLRKILERRDLIGYLAARNVRILSTALTEYDRFRDDCIRKFGKPDGTTVRLAVDTPEFENFRMEMEPLDALEHEITFLSAKYSEVVGKLSGEEIFSIDWMLED